MDFKVKQETLEKVFTYLTEQPFREVNALLQELQKSQPIVEDGEAVEPEILPVKEAKRGK